jgi:hypothetical protein
MVTQYPTPNAWDLFPKICRDSFKFERVSATYMIGRLDGGGFQSWHRGFPVGRPINSCATVSGTPHQPASARPAPALAPAMPHTNSTIQRPHPRQNSSLDLAATLPMSQDLSKSRRSLREVGLCSSGRRVGCGVDGWSGSPLYWSVVAGAKCEGEPWSVHWTKLWDSHRLQARADCIVWRTRLTHLWAWRRPPGKDTLNCSDKILGISVMAWLMGMPI